MIDFTQSFFGMDLPIHEKSVLFTWNEWIPPELLCSIHQQSQNLKQPGMLDKAVEAWSTDSTVTHYSFTIWMAGAGIKGLNFSVIFYHTTSNI